MSFRDDAHLKALRDYTAKVPLSIMQVAPNEGAFLEVLAASMGAKKAIEVGVFTGYSALCTARGLAPGGKLLALDISDEHIPFASRVWREAGVADRIDFRKGDARAILKQLSENPSEQGTWDLAFIDADKVSYDIYYEHILKLLRKGGVIAVDNVLWDGAVADPLVNDEDTKALRALNKKVTTHSTTIAMPSVPHQTPIV
ncbi:mdmC [Symbiodinium sp. KB8]|nr:mdmC [Symbiodinium sp. KB8]